MKQICLIPPAMNRFAYLFPPTSLTSTDSLHWKLLGGSHEANLFITCWGKGEGGDNMNRFASWQHPKSPHLNRSATKKFPGSAT